MLGKETAVSTVEDIHLWEGQFRVLVDIDGSISVTNEFGPMAISKSTRERTYRVKEIKRT